GKNDAAYDNDQQIKRDEIALLRTSQVNQQGHHHDVAGHLHAAVPGCPGQPPEQDKVKDSDRDPEDDQGEKKPVGAQTRHISRPHNTHRQNERDREQQDTRQPFQPSFCRKTLVHDFPAPSASHQGIPKSRQENRGRGEIMDQSFATKAWLEWLARVRLLTITLILTVGVVWPQYVPGLSPNRFFLTLIIFWITVGILHLILLRWLPRASWHGGMQVAGDVVMVTLLVYLTGSQESYFISLYLLVIIVGSIVFSRRVAFFNAAVCFSLLTALTLLAYTGKLPRTSTALPPIENLRTWLVMNLLGFLAVAYLTSLLVHSLRSKGQELEEKREELLSLQDFTQDIIHSMRGGLITTDLAGVILLLNRTGEEILGHRFADVRGKKLQELNQDFWLPGQYPNVEK